MKAPLFVLCLLTACGSDAPSQEGSSDAAAPTPDAAEPACTYNGFAPETEIAERDTELDVLFYTGSRGQDPEIERMSLDFYFPLGATDNIHTFTFDGENLQDCHSCLLLRRHCKSGNCISGQVFLAQEGSADFTSLGKVGERFQGTLRNVVFAEVTIESMLKTVLVPNGERWCIDTLDFDVPVSNATSLR